MLFYYKETNLTFPRHIDKLANEIYVKGNDIGMQLVKFKILMNWIDILL